MKHELKNDPKRDLQHFLRLSTAQVRHRLVEIEQKETYSPRINRLRMLEELIKEQVTDENPGHPTRTTR